MNRRAVRIAVWVLACAAIGAAAYGAYGLQREAIAEREALRVVDGDSHRAAVLVERLRAAQQSYVAEGQGPAFWMTRVTETTAALEEAIGALARDATSDGTRAAAQAALSALADYEKLDRRARGYVTAGSRLMASDLIFTDSLGATTAIQTNIEKARTEQQEWSLARQAAFEQQQAGVLGGAAAAALLLTLLLVAPVRPDTPKDTREALRALIGDAPAGAAVIRPDPRPTQPPAAAEGPRPEPESIEMPEVPRAAAPPEEPGVDLALTARLCSEFARVFDPNELPPLLGRAADLLDASGVIVWVADRAGTALYPAAAHGYSQALLSRMTGIRRDADNAAAAAWRHAQIRTVAAQGDIPGALVTPIVTPEGCIGVLAAETRHGSEARGSTQAIAAILAAQIATLVTTLPTTDQPAPNRQPTADA